MQYITRLKYINKLKSVEIASRVNLIYYLRTYICIVKAYLLQNNHVNSICVYESI